MTAIGTHVARSRDSSVHIVRVAMRGGKVACLCGTVVMYPRTTRLSGPDCVTCAAVQKGKA